MKKFLFIMTALYVNHCLPVQAFKSEVFSIEKDLVKFSNGQIAYIDQYKSKLKKGNYVEFYLNDELKIKQVNQIDNTSYNKYMNYLLEPDDNSPSSFTPTVINSLEEANKIFKRSNPYFEVDSECSDRAHVWAHDEFEKNNVKSMKAFIFFTASYIKRAGLKWWFHVAPMYRVNHSGRTQDLVMDFAFSDSPLTVKEWSDLFVFSKRPCKVTTKFSEYDVNPQTEDCYIIFESMHYRLPSQIFDQERRGIYKNQTSQNELKQSLDWAFRKKRGFNL